MTTRVPAVGADEIFTHAVERIPLDAVARLLRDAYAIECSAIERLAGERDQNYRVADDHGTEFVLKIAHPSERLVAAIEFTQSARLT